MSGFDGYRPLSSVAKCRFRKVRPCAVTHSTHSGATLERHVLRVQPFPRDRLHLGGLRLNDAWVEGVDAIDITHDLAVLRI